MADITIEKIKQDLETAAYVDRLLPAVRAPVLYAGYYLHAAGNCFYGQASS